MSVGYFLSVTAMVEAVTGFALLLSPSFPITWLLGINQPSAEVLLISRITGAALLTIAITAWCARSENHGKAQLGLLTGLLFYDGAAAALLAYAGSVLSMAGMALWPAVAAHAVLAVWCAACLFSEAARRKQRV
jgi:hypothetical protein